MGLVYPPPAQTIWQNNLPATPSGVWGTTVTASASLHTKGNYAQLIAATTYDSYGFWLVTANSATGGAATPQLMDIAIGAAASEVVIVPDIQTGWKIILTTSYNVQYFPIFIPRGSRVAARLQALITADTIVVGIYLNGGTAGLIPTFTGCDVYGLDSANSRGTLHTPGNSGAESTDANIGSPTSRKYGAVQIEVGLGALTVASALGYHFELTDGTNTLCEWTATTLTNESLLGPFPPVPYLVSIPASTQLMVQAECSGTGEQLDVAFRCYY